MWRAGQGGRAETDGDNPTLPLEEQSPDSDDRRGGRSSHSYLSVTPRVQHTALHARREKISTASGAEYGVRTLHGYQTASLTAA